MGGKWIVNDTWRVATARSGEARLGAWVPNIETLASLLACPDEGVRAYVDFRFNG